LLALGCGPPTEPGQPLPEVAIELLLSRPLNRPDERLGDTLVETLSGEIRISISEWFPYQGFVLSSPSMHFLPPTVPGTTGYLTLNMETRDTVGIHLIWRKDHRILVRRVPAGSYRLVLVRFDPLIPTHLHPYGNPRVPVDTTVTVP
jgi:hypothetical protein